VKRAQHHSAPKDKQGRHVSVKIFVKIKTIVKKLLIIKHEKH